MPDADLIEASVSKIGYNQVQLNKEQSTVFLPQKGMKIGFGAIGKGYAADSAKQLLKNRSYYFIISNLSIQYTKLYLKLVFII